MTEPEVDSLMQGQEDENGSVNYESKASEQTKLTLLSGNNSLKKTLCYRLIGTWYTIMHCWTFAVLEPSSSLVFVPFYPAFVKNILSV